MIPASSEIPFVLFLLIPILVLASVPLVGPMTARMSGWAKLSEAYATDRECQGFKLNGRWGMFGQWMAYKGILIYGVDAEGFYISVGWIFKRGHRPLFIPWKEIVARSERIWMRDCVVMEFQAVPNVTFSILKRDAELLNENGGKFVLEVLPKA